MDSSSADAEVVHDFSPIIKMKVYKDGRVERLSGCDFAPPSLDLTTNVESKDVLISKNDDVSARIYLPKLNDPNQKLPLLLYFHGGGFVIESPFSPQYHQYLNTVVSQAHVIAVSVHYRLAPEHPVPIAFEDSWTALKWVASHFTGNGPDEWLNSHADLKKVFLAGDSAGATISHYLGLRVGTEELQNQGIKLAGIVLVHPFFWGVERIGSEAETPPELAAFAERLWRFVCPTTSGCDDPLFNPGKDPNLGRVACERVLVTVAEHDFLRERGWFYKEVMEKSGWDGAVEVMEAKGEGHVFHLFDQSCENALALLNRIVSFINHS